MYLFVLYAFLIWLAVFLFRRRWPAFLILLVSIPVALLTVRLLTLTLPVASGPVHIVVFSYEALILAVGLLLAVQPRTRPVAFPCRRCAYDLSGNASGRCPECGDAIVRWPRGHAAVAPAPPAGRVA